MLTRRIEEKLTRDDSPVSCPPSSGAVIGGTPGRRNDSRNNSRPTSRGRDDESVRRPLSHKKQRRFTKEHHIGIEMMQDEIDETTFNVNAASKIIYHQDYQSVFEDFTDEMREAFLNCEGGFAAFLERHPNSKIKVWQNTPADRFHQVDKKLRYHLLHTGIKEPFSVFIDQLERYLLKVFELKYFEDAFKDTIPEDFLESVCISMPVGFVSHCGYPTVDLRLNSGVYRLLAHGLCQFHGLVTDSFDSRDSKERILRIQTGWCLAEEDDACNEKKYIFGGKETWRIIPYMQTVAKSRTN